MKKSFIILLVCAVLTALFAACGESDVLPTPSPTVETTTPAPTPSESPKPDFSGTDFTGNWVVGKVIASDGTEASESEKQALGADFILELLKDGVYFVYDADGKVKGQGNYSVDLNELTLTAGDAQTVYEIIDADTLQSASEDGSVTVMARDKGETEEEPDGSDAPADTEEPEDEPTDDEAE